MKESFNSNAFRLHHILSGVFSRFYGKGTCFFAGHGIFYWKTSVNPPLRTESTLKKSDAAVLREFVFSVHEIFRETAANLPGMPNIDITVREHRVLSLVCILIEENPDGITLKQLAAAMKLAPATVSELVERLVQKELLVRVQNPNDRRAVQITPADNTRKLMDASIRSIDVVCGKLLAGLSPAEQRAMLSGLSRMSDSIPQKTS